MCFVPLRLFDINTLTHHTISLMVGWLVAGALNRFTVILLYTFVSSDHWNPINKVLWAFFFSSPMFHSALFTHSAQLKTLFFCPTIFYIRFLHSFSMSIKNITVEFFVNRMCVIDGDYNKRPISINGPLTENIMIKATPCGNLIINTRINLLTHTHSFPLLLSLSCAVIVVTLLYDFFVVVVFVCSTPLDAYRIYTNI